MAPRLHRIRLHHLRLAASLALIAASAVLLIWGFWPERRTVQVLRLGPPPTETEATEAAALHPVGALRLEFPEWIRLDDRGLVRLAFEVEPVEAVRPSEADMPDSAAAEVVHAIAEARLEMPGALVRPPDSIHEALGPDQPLEFLWTVVLDAPGEYRGTAWSFLTIPEDSSARSSRIALGAQNVRMRGIALLGMGGEAARIVGGLSLISGLVLGLPFIDPAARWVSRGRTRGV